MLKKLKSGFKHAFAVEPPDYQYTQEETVVADKFAEYLVKRKLTAPAVLFIKSSAPLNMIANQVLLFAKPFATFIFKEEEYKIFTAMLEHRNSMDFIVERIEEAERKHRSKQADKPTENAEMEVGKET